MLRELAVDCSQPAEEIDRGSMMAVPEQPTCFYPLPLLLELWFFLQDLAQRTRSNEQKAGRGDPHYHILHQVDQREPEAGSGSIYRMIGWLPLVFKLFSSGLCLQETVAADQALVHVLFSVPPEKITLYFEFLDVFRSQGNVVMGWWFVCINNLCVLVVRRSVTH